MRIRVFKGAAVFYEEKLEKQGVSITTNTGDAVDDIKATGSNIRKYIKNRKYPEYKSKKT
jgi:hypothetical protein